MGKEKKIFSLLSSLSAYAFLKEKYPTYRIDDANYDADLTDLRERILEIEKYAHIPDKYLTIESKYKKFIQLISNDEFREEVLLDDVLKKSEYLTVEEKRDIIHSVIFIMHIDHSISQIEKSIIMQISKFLEYPQDYQSIMKEYKESDFKESISKVGLSYFSKASSSVTKDKKLTDGTQRLLSLIFLGLAGFMSFLTYTKYVEGMIWGGEMETLSFTPTFISTIIAIALITPLYLRNIFKWNTSIYSIMSFILILLVFSSFVQLSLLGGNDSKMQAALAIAILLSWVGLSAIAGISWIIVLGAGVYTVIINNITMGVYGYLYIMFGFLGLILHSKLNPGELMQSMKEEYSEGTSKVIDTVKGDIQTTSSKIGSLTKGGM